MNKIQEFIARHISKIIVKSIPEKANEWQNKHAPALGKAAQAILGGATLHDAVEVYVNEAYNLTGEDAYQKVDEIFGAVVFLLKDLISIIESEPFMNALDRLPEIVIPDFDGNPDNDVTLADIFKNVIEAMASDEKTETSDKGEG